MTHQSDPLASGGQQVSSRQGSVAHYSGLPPQGTSGGFPAYPGYGMAPYLYPQQPRAFWKTWLVSLLLTIIPLVGSAMAIVYIYTRRRPQEYEAGQAALAGLIFIVNIIILAVIVYAAIALLGVTVR
ncbi:MAG: hypothetical protein R2853_07730 [Thermomicrobiales bacterium]